MVDKEKLKGPLAPVLTIFKDDMSLDLKSLRGNLKASLGAGMGKDSGMFLVCGAGGEFPSLSHEEREAVAEAAVKQLSGKAPVFIGVQHTNPVESIELAKHAEKIGADGVQASPPYYYRPTDADVYEHFKALDSSIDIPIMVYNTYWQGFNISSELLAKLVKLKRVVCVKWSAPSIFEYEKGFRILSDDVIFIDNAASPVVSSVLGAKGFISHEANFWPEHELRLQSLLEEGKYDEAKEMIAKLNHPFYDFRVRMGSRKGGEAHVIKAAMDIVGLSGGRPRPPTKALDECEIKELKEILAKAEVPSR